MPRTRPGSPCTPSPTRTSRPRSWPCCSSQPLLDDLAFEEVFTSSDRRVEQGRAPSSIRCSPRPAWHSGPASSTWATASRPTSSRREARGIGVDPPPAAAGAVGGGAAAGRAPTGAGGRSGSPTPGPRTGRPRRPRRVAGPAAGEDGAPPRGWRRCRAPCGRCGSTERRSSARPLAGFADWVVEEAERRGLQPALHCLMREGEFLGELIDSRRRRPPGSRSRTPLPQPAGRQRSPRSGAGPREELDRAARQRATTDAREAAGDARGRPRLRRPRGAGPSGSALDEE